MANVSIVDLMDRGLEYDKSAETAIDETNKKRYSDLATETHESIYNEISKQVETANISEETKNQVKETVEDSKKYVLNLAYSNVLLKEAEERLNKASVNIDQVKELAGDMVIASAEATGNALPTDADLYSEANQSIEGSRSR